MSKAEEIIMWSYNEPLDLPIIIIYAEREIEREGEQRKKQ